MTQSYFPSAACGVTEPAKALPSALVHLYNRWPLEGKKRIAFNEYNLVGEHCLEVFACSPLRSLREKNLRNPFIILISGSDEDVQRSMVQKFKVGQQRCGSSGQGKRFWQGLIPIAKI
jgi:hypothetical protein